MSSTNKMTILKNPFYNFRPRNPRVYVEFPDEPNIFHVCENKKNKKIGQKRKRINELDDKSNKRVKINYENIPFKITCFNDLLMLSKLCVKNNVIYRDCENLPKIYKSLKRLAKLIGIDNVKNQLYKYIISLLQRKKYKYKQWRNIVITGKPGQGKTIISELIAQIIFQLGESKTQKLIVGNQINMIGKYVGQTSKHVEQVVNEALKNSGVLLIDEAPNLSSNDNNTNYAEECINTLMEMMTKYKDKLIIIFSGYKEELEKNIMTINKGLKRRIALNLHIAPYTSKELYLIFLKMMFDFKLKFDRKSCVINEPWFDDNYRNFPYQGGSVESFVSKIHGLYTIESFGFDSPTLINNHVIMRAYEDYLTLLT